MRTALVTGCAGFIGSSLVDRLLEEGWKVVGIDNFNDYYDPDIKWKNIVNALNHPSFTMHGTPVSSYYISNTGVIDCVVHLAASAGVRPSLEQPQMYIDNNITESRTLLDIIKDDKVPFIFASSSSVYGNHQSTPFKETMPTEPISIYGATKTMGEHLCRSYHHAYQIPITCLRFFTCYGPRQRPDLAINKFVNNVINEEPLTLYGDGNTSRDYTYIDDIVDGILRAMNYTMSNNSFNIINLGNSKPVTLNTLVDLILNELGCPEYKRTYVELPKGDVNRTFADITLAKSLLGWEPKVDIKTGIKNFVDWVKNNE